MKKKLSTNLIQLASPLIFELLFEIMKNVSPIIVIDSIDETEIPIVEDEYEFIIKY